MIGQTADHRMVMATSAATPHFALVFANKGADETNSNSVTISVTFNGGRSFFFDTKHAYTSRQQLNLFTTLLPDDEVKSWTHDLTALNSATVSFSNNIASSWTISLGGTTSAVTAMAHALNSAGIVDLPPPWTPSGNAVPKSFEPSEIHSQRNDTQNPLASSPRVTDGVPAAGGAIHMTPLSPPSTSVSSAGVASDASAPPASAKTDNQNPTEPTNGEGQNGEDNGGGTPAVLVLFLAVLSAFVIRALYRNTRRKAVQRKIASIIHRHVEALSHKRAQLIRKGSYGEIIISDWIKEINYFIKIQIIPNLKGKELIIAEKLMDEIAISIDEAAKEWQNTNPILQEFDDDMDPSDFEIFCARQLEIAGWKARVTMRSRDQGVDVVAEKARKKIVLQCKLYSSPVGNKAVQEISAGRSHEKANYAAVVSNSRYTSSAEKLANTNGVLLLHFSELRNIDSYIVNKAVVDVRNPA